jgi:hypothetical protein
MMVDADLGDGIAAAIKHLSVSVTTATSGAGVGEAPVSGEGTGDVDAAANHRRLLSVADFAMLTGDAASRLPDAMSTSDLCACFDARHAALEAARDCERVVASSDGTAGGAAGSTEMTEYVLAAGRYASCAAEWARAAYAARVLAWLDDAAVLCHHWTGKLVWPNSELAHVLVTYSPLVLSMVMPTFISGVKVEVQGCVTVLMCFFATFDDACLELRRGCFSCSCCCLGCVATCAGWRVKICDFSRRSVVTTTRDSSWR